ncbi:hypothetical protein A3C17_02350 [Candidatus Uhrbacteria bacterium RIFCSPHIGHO2_02_FULL_53_13]|uniref:Uncharacterized protein n=2 Tax=Candidatus Uhriibacteriota TaxID=1752732 RepID=A0A1F7TXV5_9BACT|nr:MAG: hypothetical protein A3C17_02350 [Candidatus Uhrbacteria bacterium RIFCSPHIGHO2_02_FULL_53_13]OGL88997.1 MAG: hypothetical protein A3I45_01585 [Candidatus Uhrbacteria bacterium RIFCSPLOWO2_02_FULL_53_10]
MAEPTIDFDPTDTVIVDVSDTLSRYTPTHIRWPIDDDTVGPPSWMSPVAQSGRDTSSDNARALALDSSRLSDAAHELDPDDLVPDKDFVPARERLLRGLMLGSLRCALRTKECPSHGSNMPQWHVLHPARTRNGEQENARNDIPAEENEGWLLRFDDWYASLSPLATGTLLYGMLGMCAICAALIVLLLLVPVS